jgi:hypothetical protein
MANSQKKKNIIVLDESQKTEILKLIDILEEHQNKYKMFDNFIKTDRDALIIAHALLNNDYKTFKKYQLKYTTHTADKMRGMCSLSTYKKTSAICNFLQMHDKTICKKCYADRSISLYNTTLTPVLIYNTLLLKYIDICADQIPYTNNKYFRFESFSDLQSSKHFKNLLTICKKNKNTVFTLWTKAGYTLNKMMDEEKIKKLPSNINIIVSDVYINKNMIDNEYLNGLQSVLKTSNNLKCFIVYDSEEKQQKSGFYICKNKCVDCLKCYKKSRKNIFIAEKIH